MIRPSFLAVSCFALIALLSGCSADNAATDEPTSGVDELNATSLRNATLLKGSVRAGESATLQYAPSPYPGVPYLALEILPKAEPRRTGVGPLGGNELGASSLVTVEGDFPGRPTVLVVDDQFRVLARGHATTTDEGTDIAKVDAPSTGKRFVLVRDGRWIKPMDFQVRVGGP